jgi:large subunit ribosomal protein L15
MRSILRGEAMGKHGFTKHPCQHEIETINVAVLDQMIGPEGKIELSGMKVLGKGQVTRKLSVRAAAFSATAKDKIEAAGGEVVVL